MRTLLTALVAVVLLLAHAQSATADQPYDAIGRFISDRVTVCTGFVVHSQQKEIRSGGYVDSYTRIIYENWLVTASHCRGERAEFIWPKGKAAVADIIGWSARGPGYDLMVARFYTNDQIPVLQMDESPVEIGEPLLLVGYGRRALLSRVGPMAGYDERGWLMVESFASPGNSGGPVMRIGTHQVVGVALETTIAFPGYAAWLCNFAPCPIKPPYYAVPIARVKGLLPFDR